MLSGAHLANAVYFARATQELIKRADRSTTAIERLVYRHGLHTIGWAYLKRLRNLIQIPIPVDPETIEAKISVSFDEHRQLAFDLFPKDGKGPMAFFKSQGDTTPYVLRLLQNSCANQNNEALDFLKANPGVVPFPHANLLNYLSQNLAQIQG